MKVLVTGGNGYIGQHVIHELLNRHHEVIMIDKTVTNPLPQVQYSNIDIFSADNTIYEKLGRPDACIHLAWRDGFMHESPSHLNDLPLHYKFLSDLVDAGIKKLAVMGTMHEIGYWEGAVTENTPCNPRTLYGMSKDLLRRLMIKKTSPTDTRLYWLRGFYILGDDKNNHSVFTKVLEASEKGDEYFPFTAGTNKFDFIKVTELARQIVAAVSQEHYCGIINCCSGKAVSLGERMEQFIRENHLQIKLQYHAFPNRIDESPEIYGDSSIIENILKEGSK